MTAPGSTPAVSIVIPVFEEQESLPELVARLGPVVDQLGGVGRCEVIVVDDGSRDGSLAALEEASASRPWLVVVELIRNFGQHAAVLAGFEVARGEIVVTLDGDLQNPPEEIPRLVAKMAEGYDVVGTFRRQREDSLFRRICSGAVNRLTSRITGNDLRDYGCMLRAYRSQVVAAINGTSERGTFVPVLAEKYAGRVTEIEVGHSERPHGTSKYGVLGLLRLALDLVTGFTVLPLRAAMAIGLVTSVVSIVAAAVLLAGRLIYGSEWAVGGVFTLFAFLFFLLGVLLFAVGVLGEYLGRVYSEVRGRPRYVIRRVVGGGPGRAG